MGVATVKGGEGFKGAALARPKDASEESGFGRLLRDLGEEVFRLMAVTAFYEGDG